MKYIIILVAAIMIHTGSVLCQMESGNGASVEMLFCTNKIRLCYYENGIPKEGCFDSRSQVESDPLKTLVGYSINRPNGTFNYLPMKVAFPYYEVEKLAAISNSSCNTFDIEEARRCFQAAVGWWNSVCNDPSRKLIVVDDENEAHTIVRVSSDPDDFSISPGGRLQDIQGQTLLHTAILNGQASWYNSIKSHKPDLRINLTDEFIKANQVWSTDCPCDAGCDEQQLHCRPFCRMIYHEIAHLYGYIHAGVKDGMCIDPTDPNYDEYAHLFNGGKSCNSWTPDIDEICDMQLRNMDNCIFCKTVCPEKCDAIPTGIVLSEDAVSDGLSVDIFPNPVSSTLSCVVRKKDNTEAYIAIYALSGRMVLTKYLGNGADVYHTLDLRSANIITGSYIIVFYTEKEHYSRRLEVF